MVTGCLGYTALQALPVVAPRWYKYAVSALLFKCALTLQQRATFVKITVGMYFKMHKDPFKFTQNCGESQYTHTEKLIIIYI